MRKTDFPATRKSTQTCCPARPRAGLKESTSCFYTLSCARRASQRGYVAQRVPAQGSRNRHPVSAKDSSARRASQRRHSAQRVPRRALGIDTLFLQRTLARDAQVNADMLPRTSPPQGSRNRQPVSTHRSYVRRQSQHI